jgi:cytoskeletal protein CcmA (bactofilin family)
MNKLKKSVVCLFLLMLLLIPVSPAYAQSSEPGKIVFGDDYTLETGESLEGDLVVFGGNVAIEEDADLNGNLVVFGGIISSDGNVNGDVVVFGGQISLDENAVVSGDVVTIGGQLDRAEGAEIQGEVVKNVSPDIQIPSGRIPPDVNPPSIHFNFNPLTDVFWAFFWAVALAGFAMLLVLFWQPQIERAGALIFTQPMQIGAIGLLAFVLGLLFILTVIPPIVVAFAWLFGVVAMGMEVGERLARSVNQTWGAVQKVGLGTFLLVLVGGLVGMIPCIGGLVQFLFGLLGIGGALMTWFGNRTTFLPSVPSQPGSVAPDQLPPTS